MIDDDNIIREFRTERYRVVVRALPEYDLDLSFDETGEVREKLENGTFVAFTVHAYVESNKHGIIGEDYLGDCIHENINDFQDHKEVCSMNRKLESEGKSSRVGSYFHDMIKEAIAEARLTLKEMGITKA